MIFKKNGPPVSALKKWLLIASCLTVGLLLGLFISGSARNNLDMAREWPVDGESSPVIEYKPVQLAPPGVCSCLKEAR